MSSNTNHHLPLRRLGKDGPEIPALGLGLLGMSTLYGKQPSDEDRFAVLDRALELGATHWDSADMYGDSENLLGKWFKRTGKRDQIFLVTKFGFKKGSNTDIDSSADFCKKACDASLKTLGVDYIDLYYLHRANPKTPIEETMQAMLDLKAAGKIKHIGLCEISSATLRRACKVGKVDVIQCEYSAFDLDIEGQSGTNLLATCRELGVGVVAYAPLGRGLLTGNLESKVSISGEGDYRNVFPRFSDENLDANLRVVAQLKAIADEKHCTTAQLAIAWVLKQGPDIIPIPGTKKIKYLEENVGALAVELTDAEERRVRDIVSQVAGKRAPDWADYQNYVDTVELK
ncbi:putative aldo/keto reductase [Xylaria bambusicola]|uniref:putative aldo/keto reductase n=1 Tax=Xylaria bambusicola TaxID=326684 RepID=UPI002007B756|nr:putative aldo/keto reductase [Xylaria bambusicola]KAI0521285.1 putative aldo/keto reductase [Xylaria bambusicola]